MANNIRVDTVLNLHILISLNSGPKHGYELMKSLEESLGRKISASLVYPFLKDMRKNKYVSFEKNGREKVYTLTSDGRKFVKQTLLRFHKIIKQSIDNMLEKCYHCGCQVYDNKYEEKADGKMRPFCCSHCAESYRKGKNGKAHAHH